MANVTVAVALAKKGRRGSHGGEMGGELLAHLPRGGPLFTSVKVTSGGGVR